MTPGELREYDGIELCVVHDLGGEGAPSVVGIEEECLKGSLSETVDEGKSEEGHRDPVQGDPQVDRFDNEPCPMGHMHIGKGQ